MDGPYGCGAYFEHPFVGAVHRAALAFVLPISNVRAIPADVSIGAVFNEMVILFPTLGISLDVQPYLLITVLIPDHMVVIASLPHLKIWKNGLDFL